MNYRTNRFFDKDEHCVNLLDARARYDEMREAGIRTFADAADDGDILVVKGDPSEPFRKSSIPYFIYEGTPVPRTELEARETAAFVRAKLIEIMNQQIESEATRISIEVIRSKLLEIMNQQIENEAKQFSIKALSDLLQNFQRDLDDQKDWYRKAKQTKLFYGSQYTLLELYAARQGWTIGTVSLDPGFTAQLRMMRKELESTQKELETNQQILVDIDVRVTHLAEAVEKLTRQLSSQFKPIALGK